MKYSEFNKKYADLELQYTDSDVYIYCDGVMVGKISKEYRYRMSTHYDGFEQFPEGYAANLLMNMNMLSETPLSEREEEKRYWLQKIPVPLLKESDDLWYYEPINKLFKPGVDRDRTDNEKYKSIFTESEIAEMDITGFEKIEVAP